MSFIVHLRLISRSSITLCQLPVPHFLPRHAPSLIRPTFDVPAIQCYGAITNRAYESGKATRRSTSGSSGPFRDMIYYPRHETSKCDSSMPHRNANWSSRQASRTQLLPEADRSLTSALQSLFKATHRMHAPGSSVRDRRPSMCNGITGALLPAPLVSPSAPEARRS